MASSEPLLGAGSTNTGGGSGGFNPSKITGLNLWLDATAVTSLYQDVAGTVPALADNDPVRLWKDLSSAHCNVATLSGYNPATLKLADISGLNDVLFNGSSPTPVALGTLSYGYSGAEITLSIVRSRISNLWDLFQLINPSDPVPALNDDHSGGHDARRVADDGVVKQVAAEFSNSNWGVYTVTYKHNTDPDPDVLTLYLNDIQIAYANVTSPKVATGLVKLLLGGDGTGVGKIGEVCAYNRWLNSSELSQVNQYLFNKWLFLPQQPNLQVNLDAQAAQTMGNPNPGQIVNTWYNLVDNSPFIGILKNQNSSLTFQQSLGIDTARVRAVGISQQSGTFTISYPATVILVEDTPVVHNPDYRALGSDSQNLYMTLDRNGSSIAYVGGADMGVGEQQGPGTHIATLRLNADGAQANFYIKDDFVNDFGGVTNGDWGELWFGCNNYEGSDTAIKQVLVWDVALTNSELEQAINFLKARWLTDPPAPVTSTTTTPNPDGLILCLDAGDPASYPGHGSVWYDTSGYGNNFLLRLYDGEPNDQCWVDAGQESYMDFYNSLCINAEYKDITAYPEQTCLVLCAMKDQEGNNDFRTFFKSLDVNYQALTYYGVDDIGYYSTIYNNYLSSGVGFNVVPDPLGSFNYYVFQYQDSVSNADNESKPYYISRINNGIMAGSMTYGFYFQPTRGGIYSIGGDWSQLEPYGQYAQFVGNVALVKMWNRKLTQAEINAEIASYAARFPTPTSTTPAPAVPVQTGLQMWLDAADPNSYTINDSSWYDLTPNNNVLTWQNESWVTYSELGWLRHNYVGYWYASSTTGVPVGNSPYSVTVWTRPDDPYWGTIYQIGADGVTNEVNAAAWASYLGVYGSLKNYWWGNDLEDTTYHMGGQWYSITCQWDGNERSIWVNGVKEAFDITSGINVTSSEFTLCNSNPSSVIGYRTGNNDTSVVLVYDKALQEGEIVNNYNLYCQRYGRSPLPPVPTTTTPPPPDYALLWNVDSPLCWGADYTDILEY